VMKGRLRAQAFVAADALAWSSCGSCSVDSLGLLGKDVVQARFSVRTPNMPSQCIYVAPAQYRPALPSTLPEGVSWGPCIDTVGRPVSPAAWRPPAPEASGRQRSRLRAFVTSWLPRRCGASACRIAKAAPIASGLWFVRVSPQAVKPSACFFVDTTEDLPPTTRLPPVGVTWVDCSQD
jgi:hypothetical protein